MEPTTFRYCPIVAPGQKLEVIGHLEPESDWCEDPAFTTRLLRDKWDGKITPLKPTTAKKSAANKSAPKDVYTALAYAHDCKYGMTLNPDGSLSPRLAIAVPIDQYERKSASRPRQEPEICVSPGDVAPLNTNMLGAHMKDIKDKALRQRSPRKARSSGHTLKAEITATSLPSTSRRRLVQAPVRGRGQKRRTESTPQRDTTEASFAVAPLAASTLAYLPSLVASNPESSAPSTSH